jgi:hypothetical protein
MEGPVSQFGIRRVRTSVTAPMLAHATDKPEKKTSFCKTGTEGAPAGDLPQIQSVAGGCTQLPHVSVGRTLR